LPVSLFLYSIDAVIHPFLYKRYDRLLAPMSSVPCDCLGGSDCFSESSEIPAAQGKACSGQTSQITVSKSKQNHHLSEIFARLQMIILY
jgi:hypothetical protein